jgi:hypothetical protein
MPARSGRCQCYEELKSRYPETRVDHNAAVKERGCMDTGDWILVVAAVVLAQIALLGIEWLRSWLERRQREHDRRADFEHQTLIEPHDALGEVMRVKLGHGPGTVDRVRADRLTQPELVRLGRRSITVWSRMNRNESVRSGTATQGHRTIARIAESPRGQYDRRRWCGSAKMPMRSGLVQVRGRVRRLASRVPDPQIRVLVD